MAVKETESERKARVALEIEENVKQVREKQEREHRHEESVKAGTTPQQIRQWKKQEPYKPHGTFGQTVQEKAKAGAASGLKQLMETEKPEPKGKKKIWIDKTHYTYAGTDPRIFDYKPAPRKSTRTGPPRLRTRTPAGQLGYFTPARPRKSTRRQPAQKQEFGALSFTGAGFGSLGGGGRTSELNFFTQSKGKKKKGRGSILDFTL